MTDRPPMIEKEKEIHEFVSAMEIKKRMDDLERLGLIVEMLDRSNKRDQFIMPGMWVALGCSVLGLVPGLGVLSAVSVVVWMLLLPVIFYDMWQFLKVKKMLRSLDE